MHNDRLHFVIGFIAVVAAGFIVTQMNTRSLEARVIEQTQTTGTWRTLMEYDVGSGATIPAGRHVFFHIPSTIETISREVLFGQHGEQVRYWGYCFSDEDDPKNPPQTTGFPGKIFLSEAERKWRKAEVDKLNVITPLKPLPIVQERAQEKSTIRHQIDIFWGGMICYIMASQELAIGIDPDGDGLNSQAEKKYLTNPTKTDTDGDGLNDGKEVLLGTHPTRRDTDGDGIIDGIEDANHNGRADHGETDPRNRDTDGDRLYDGVGRDYKSRKICKDNKGKQCMDVPYGQQMGEDRNFNGKVDSGESDPRLPDTDGDGIWDDQAFYRCLLDGRKDC